jgi:Protein of unknown function (DUF3300)
VKRLLCLLCPFLIGLAILPAQAQQQPPAPPGYSQQDLDQLLAPVALYPDPLLSQVLMAATYPLEVVEAARFVQQNPGLSGSALAQAVQDRSWDPSVKSLTQFPTVLSMMNDQLDWMQNLGDAFLAQQAAVMDTVQALRAKARAAGTLTSNQQQSVQIADGAIDIEPYTADTVYVPYYDPNVVYGSWWWPQSPPFVWVPPSYYGYVPAYGIGFSTGISIGFSNPLFVYSRPNWGAHNFVNYAGPPHINPAGQGSRAGWGWPSAGGTVWAHRPIQAQAGPVGNRGALRSVAPAAATQPASRLQSNYQAQPNYAPHEQQRPAYEAQPARAPMPAEEPRYMRQSTAPAEAVHPQAQPQPRAEPHAQPHEEQRHEGEYPDRNKDNH